MKEIHVRGNGMSTIFEQMRQVLQGKVEEHWGEYTLDFDTDIGKGIIRGISFDWGVSLLDYDVFFNEEIKLIFHTEKGNPIEFIFVSEGSLKYFHDKLDKSLTLDRYQNVIVSSPKNTVKTYVFPVGIPVKVNFINVIKDEYSRKKNNNISYLTADLLELFNSENSEQNFEHFGSFNLKIADQIRKLNSDNEKGIVRTLGVEGQLNLIMALQILEHQNELENKRLPDSLTKDEIKKVSELTEFIIDNVSEHLSVDVLAKEANLSTKKLQSGFRVLYSKSVNEYIRQIKLEIARDEIRNSDQSISEIVYKIGFKSRSYFSKIFYERYHILPIEYRKKVKYK